MFSNKLEHDKFKYFLYIKKNSIAYYIYLHIYYVILHNNIY